MSFLEYLMKECSYEDLVGFWNVYVTDKYPHTRIYGSLEEYCDVHNCSVQALCGQLDCSVLQGLSYDLWVDAYGGWHFFDSLEGSPINLEVLARIMAECGAVEYRYWMENGTLED